jgi:hypothetical protein
LTRRFPPDQLFAELHKPLQRTLERLTPVFPEIRFNWGATLARFVRRHDEYDAVTGLALDRYQPHLAAGDFAAFTREMLQQGHALASLGVAEEHAFLALALYQEHCLAALAREAPGEPELPTRAPWAGARSTSRIGNAWLVTVTTMSATT